MKAIYKSFKFRLYPTKDQEILLSKHFGHCRYVFNRFLNERKEKYLNDKTSLNYYDHARTLTELKKEEEFVWLKEMNSQSLQAAIKNLDTAYKNFFNKQHKFPRFKAKYDRQSFKIPQNVRVEGGKLVIPKFKEGIKVNLHRQMEGESLFATISSPATGQYYVSITCQVEHTPFEKTGKLVDVDTGIKELAILSDGSSYENIKSLKIKLKKLKYEQQQVSKKQKGSHRRDKQKQRLALVHQRITNIRRDYLHKVSTEIIKNHDLVSVEDLAVKNMMKNRCLAQAMSDVSLGTFYTLLEYKANWNDSHWLRLTDSFLRARSVRVVDG